MMDKDVKRMMDEMMDDRFHKLDENKKPIPCSDIEEWGDLRSTKKKWEKNHRVDLTEFNDGSSVSTVFLGWDHNIYGKPQWFESMYFNEKDPKTDQTLRRYETWNEAVQGHHDWVKEIGKPLKVDVSNIDSHS